MRNYGENTATTCDDTWERTRDGQQPNTLSIFSAMGVVLTQDIHAITVSNSKHGHSLNISNDEGAVTMCLFTKIQEVD